MFHLDARQRAKWRRVFLILSAAMAVVVWVVFTTSGGNPVDAWDFWVDPANPYVVGDGHAYLLFARLCTSDGPIPVGRLRGVRCCLPSDRTAGCVLARRPRTLPRAAPPTGGHRDQRGEHQPDPRRRDRSGLQVPALWAIVLLTKPTMAVGLLWFVFRRDYRSLAIALGTTLAIAAVSFAIDPGAWADYVWTLANTSPTPGWPFPWPIWVRLPFVLALVIWGSVTCRPWAVALGTMLAAPRLYFLSPVMLLGLLPLLPRSSFVKRIRSTCANQDVAERAAPSPTGQPAVSA